MSEAKKTRQPLSPEKRLGSSPEDEQDFKELFPELPPFFADITSLLKDDPLIKAYQREILYEGERERCAKMSSEVGTVSFIRDLRENTDNFGEYSVPSELIPAMVESAPSKLPASPEADIPHYADPFTSNNLTTSYFSKQWQNYQYKPCETFELILKTDILEGNKALEIEKRDIEQETGLPSSPIPIRGEREKTVAVINSFHELFPADSILVRSSQETCAAELFCESIAKDIVNLSAELYISRCFESMKEGYTSHSVWEEMRETVCRAFLPQDYEQLPLTNDSRESPQCFGYIGDAVDLQNQKFKPSYSTLYMNQDVPSSLLLTAREKVKLASKQSLSQLHDVSMGRYAGGRNAVDQATVKHHSDPNIGAGSAPCCIPIDEHCRYIVPVTDPITVDPRAPSFALPGQPEAIRVHSSEPKEQGSEAVNKSNEVRPPSAPRGPVRPYILGKRVPKQSAPVTDPGQLSVSSIRLDELTTALKKLPPSYYVQHVASGDSASIPESGRVRSQPPTLDSSVFDSTLRSSMKSQASLPRATKPDRRKAAKGDRQLPLIHIDGENVMLTRDNELIARNQGNGKKRNQPGDESATPIPKAVKFNVAKTTADEGTPVEQVNTLNKPARHQRLPPEELKKAADRKRQKEMLDQREREKLFVIPLQQSDDVRNHMEVVPEPGVMVQCLPSNMARHGLSAQLRPGVKTKKDEPQTIADGGEYIVAENKQSWTENSKAFVNAKGFGKSKEEGGDKQRAAQSNATLKGGVIDAKTSIESKILREGKSRSPSQPRRQMQRSAPKIRKAASNETPKEHSGRIIAAQNTSSGHERLPSLPFKHPSSRSEPEARQTKRTSFTAQERLNVLASSLG